MEEKNFILGRQTAHLCRDQTEQILGVESPSSSRPQHPALTWELPVPAGLGLSPSVSVHILLLINETAHLFINRAFWEMLAGVFFFFSFFPFCALP